jgi:hypothetical protein
MEESNFTPYAIIPKTRLDLSIGGGGGSLGGGMGGRVGLDIPMGDGSLNVGVSGQGSYNPGQGVNVMPTGIDASYTTGNNTFQAKFDQMSPDQQSLMLNYIKQF